MTEFSRRSAIGVAGAGALATLFIATSQEKEQLMKAINPEGSLIPGISQAMLAGHGQLLFLSGHVPFAKDGTIVGTNLGQQLNQVFLNIAATLAAAGADFSHVARLTIYVRDYDPSQLDTIRRIRDAFVRPDRPPASALIGVAALFHPEVRVEVDAVAVV